MPINYANAKIYCIRQSNDNDKIVYVDSTVRPLSERMAQHRRDVSNYPHYKIYNIMVNVGVENFYIELIHNYPCACHEELLKEEGRIVRMHDTLKNGGNTILPGRTKKQNYEENRDVKCTMQKNYYNANKEVAIVKQQAYREANPEKVKASRVKYNEEHREEAKQLSREYYQANREKALACSKAYYERKKAEKATAAIPQQ